MNNNKTTRLLMDCLTPEIHSGLRINPVMIDLDWRPGEYVQSLGRLKRGPGPKDSRNKREGRYNFKVRGRHTRARRKLIVIRSKA